MCNYSPNLTQCSMSTRDITFLSKVCTITGHLNSKVPTFEEISFQSRGRKAPYRSFALGQSHTVKPSHLLTPTPSKLCRKRLIFARFLPRHQFFLRPIFIRRHPVIYSRYSTRHLKVEICKDLVGEDKPWRRQRSNQIATRFFVCQIEVEKRRHGNVFS